MAGFRMHVGTAAAVGAAYSVLAIKPLGFTPEAAILAGGLAAVGGMLPDLDSDSGKPVREIFSLAATVVPMLLIPRLHDMRLSHEASLLVLITLYLFIRHGLAALLARITIHRGMFHSIPAMFIPALVVYLAWSRRDHSDGIVLALGVALGYFSHLLLDEIYAVDFNGVSVKLNQFAGTALKLTNPKDWKSTIFCWSILLFLSYRVATEEGYVPDYLPTVKDLRSMKQKYFGTPTEMKPVKDTTSKAKATA